MRSWRSSARGSVGDRGARPAASESLARHHRELHGLPYAKAKLLVESDRCGVGCKDMQEGALRATLDVCHQGGDQPGGESLALIVGSRAHGADLRPIIQTKSLAGHRHQRAFAADTDVIAKLDRPLQKRPRLGLRDELEYLRNVRATE